MENFSVFVLSKLGGNIDNSITYWFCLNFVAKCSVSVDCTVSFSLSHDNELDLDRKVT